MLISGDSRGGKADLLAYFWIADGVGNLLITEFVDGISEDDLQKIAASL